MKTLFRFTLCFGVALFFLAACEGGFVEPKGRLIVKNNSSTAIITSVHTKQSSFWLQHWTGNAAQNDEITLKLEPGVYDVQIFINESYETPYECLSVSVPAGEKRLVFTGSSLLEE